MIRCYPIDGSAPFEVEHHEPAFDGCLQMPIDRSLRLVDGLGLSLRVRGVQCRIESWRERAERLEKELDELRRMIALDAMDKRRESEQG